MAKTKFELLQERVFTFARKYQVPVEETAISGNHGLLGVSEMVRQAPDEGIVSVIHILVNPEVVLTENPDGVFKHGLWCGLEYQEENFSYPSALGVFSQEKINVLAYPIWPVLDRIELDGLWFVDHKFLEKAKTVSIYNKHQLKVFSRYVEQLGRFPTAREEEYLSAVRNFDEYYHYSDDGSVFRAGLEKERHLKWLAGQLDNHQVLWALAKEQPK